MREAGVGMAAVAEQIEYKRELFPGDTVTVHTELIQVTNSSCRFKHTMTREEDGGVMANAERTSELGLCRFGRDYRVTFDSRNRVQIDVTLGGKSRCAEASICPQSPEDCSPRVLR